MRKFMFVVTLWFGAFMSVAGSAQQYEPCTGKENTVRSDGECWNSLSPVAKLNVIRGIWVGNVVYYIGLDIVAQNPTFGSVRNWTEAPSKTLTSDISGYFDRLYSTPANRPIAWKWAYLLAVMEARDDDTDDRLSLIRLLRQHGELPTYGKLLRARTADTVVIEWNEKQFDVHLDGVTEAGLTPDQKKNTITFINSLAKTGFFGCERSSPATIWISFPVSIFQGDNRLSGKVQLVDSNMICIGNKEVSFEDLGGTDFRLDIGRVLIAKGLALPDAFVDPKWPDALVKYRTPEYLIRTAKEKALYAYGKGTDPAVERVLGRSTF